MLEDGRPLGPPAAVHELRSRGMLRFLEEQACHEALPPYASSHHAIPRAGRRLGLVLRRPGGARLFMTDPWPPLPLSEWQDTCDTLHMWTQVVGKTRMALTPLVNHWWNVPLYVTPRGLTTSPVPYGSSTFEAEFDFIGHKLHMCDCDGAEHDIALYPRSVADFYAEYMSCLRSLGIEVKINTLPSEFPDAIRFEEDHKHTAYDKQYIERFHHI